MPIYEYECKACGKRFDRMQSFQDEPIRICPHCGGETRRVFQAVGVIFKGSGWYKTDSRKPEATESSKASPPDGKKAESGGNGAGSNTPATEPAKPSSAPAGGGDE